MYTREIKELIETLLNQKNDKEPLNEKESLIKSNRLDSLDIAELSIYLEDKHNIYISTSDPDLFDKLDTIELINTYIKNNKEYK